MVETNLYLVVSVAMVAAAAVVAAAAAAPGLFCSVPLSRVMMIGVRAEKQRENYVSFKFEWKEGNWTGLRASEVQLILCFFGSSALPHHQEYLDI
jgi:hypothetical protein